MTKTAIVTGASRGIGRSIAARLADDGANVVVNYQGNAVAANEAVAEITESGGRAIAIQADLAVSADVEHLFKDALAVFGGIDILVNNAAHFLYGSTAELSEAEFDRAVAVNIKGTFLALQQASRHLNDGGRVINISGEATRTARANLGALAATKAAIEQLGLGLAKELGPRGITVNNVLPGITDTGKLTVDDRAALEPIVASTPLGRLGEPSDIAEIVAFLAGDGARWLTGQNIGATGGLA
ncbi:SDR family oxidoreductase [Streptomyces boninensis]|uniref:SDR family oxidoreductase n=1 Tax=Streptomyces boninensis TaxID=2039455 RepID=UPI003B21CBCC